MSEKKKKVSTFLRKLYQILSVRIKLNNIQKQTESNKEIISWDESGLFFQIKNQRKFCDEILKKYFKSNNYSSFVRQLNLYNFHKKGDLNLEEFQNENFQKNKPDLLTNIQRQNKSKLKIECGVENRICFLKFSENLKLNTVNTQMFENLKEKMIDACHESLNVMNGIEKLEKKFEFLSCCKSDLDKRTERIKKELIKQSQRSKDLEQIFISTLHKVLPNITIKPFSLLDDEEEKINRINNLFNNVNSYIKSHKDISIDNMKICSLNCSCGCNGRCHCKNQSKLYDNFCFCNHNCNHENLNIIEELNYIEQITKFNKNIFYKDNKIENFLMIDDDNKILDNYDGLSPLNSNFSFFDKNNEKEFILPSPSQTLLNFSFHSLSEDNFIGKKRNNDE